MPNTQLLKIEIISIIDLLPLEGLKLLARFIAFLRAKFRLDKLPLANPHLENFKPQLFPKELTTSDKILNSLVKVGLSQPRYFQQTIPPNPVSLVERNQLANILGQAVGKPLSEIVIEERGVW